VVYVQLAQERAPMDAVAAAAEAHGYTQVSPQPLALAGCCRARLAAVLGAAPPHLHLVAYARLAYGAHEVLVDGAFNGDPHPGNLLITRPQPGSQRHALALIDSDLHRPPLLLVSWGTLMFKCVVESISHRFTMFLESGIPVRATVTLALRQAKSATEQQEEIKKQSPDHAKIHAVQRGESLQMIAAREYEDPAEWRRIADANGIDDPLQLEPGRRLMIPPILR
jgi:hypothetical protein